jgi:alcohol dehydrogenase class IV
MAHPLGCRYNIPHGTICALLLPYVMEYNLEYALEKYANIARLLGEETEGMTTEQAADKSVEAVRRILDKVEIPFHLREFGVREEDFPLIIEESLPSGSLKHNPRPLGADDVRYLLEVAM